MKKVIKKGRQREGQDEKNNNKTRYRQISKKSNIERKEQRTWKRVRAGGIRKYNKERKIQISMG